MITFIELAGFTKHRAKLLTDDEFRLLQEALIDNPEKGDVISNTGGFRKLRWGRASIGKSGGVRIIYYNVMTKGRIYLALIYPKNAQDNLSDKQRKALRTMVHELS